MPSSSKGRSGIQASVRRRRGSGGETPRGFATRSGKVGCCSINGESLWPSCEAVSAGGFRAPLRRGNADLQAAVVGGHLLEVARVSQLITTAALEWQELINRQSVTMLSSVANVVAPAALGPPGFHTTARDLQTCTFEGPGASKHHQNSTKGPPERDTKRAKRWRAREKKARNFGHPPSGPHPSGVCSSMLCFYILFFFIKKAKRLKH